LITDKFLITRNEVFAVNWQFAVLVASVAKEPGLTGTLDFAGQASLVTRAGAGFFAGENFVLPADEASHHISVAESYLVDVF